MFGLGLARHLRVHTSVGLVTHCRCIGDRLLLGQVQAEIVRDPSQMIVILGYPFVNGDLRVKFMPSIETSCASKVYFFGGSKTL